MKEKHHFAADVDADYYMANSGYGVSNFEIQKQSQIVSIQHKFNCESIQGQSLAPEVRGLYMSAKVECRIYLPSSDAFVTNT